MKNLLLGLVQHTPVFGLIIGLVAKSAGDYLQSVIPKYDALPALGKQAAAVVLSFLLVAIVHAFPGVAIPDACTAVASTGISSTCIAGLTSQDFLTAIIGGLSAVAIKHGQQNDVKQATASAPPTASTPVATGQVGNVSAISSAAPPTA